MKNHLIAIACSLFLANCGTDLMADLKDLQAVQAEVSRVTREEAVKVGLNNGTLLTVSLINSPSKALAKEPKEVKAREIAEIAYRAFPRPERLERVVVVFVEHRRYFFLFNYTNATDVHIFKGSDLALPPSKAAMVG